MTPRFQTAILVVALAFNSTALANIVLVDDPSLPPSADGFNITRDTGTGLEWLDLDVSAGRTFDDLTGGDGSNEFAPGGDFEGFRYATHEELTGAINGPQLDSLYKSLGISPFDFSSIGGYTQARSLISIVGCFGACASYGYANGTLLADDGVTEAVASMEAFTSQGYNWGRSETFGPPLLFPPNDAFALQQGNWLVRHATADADADGVVDAADNCIDVANMAQIDADGDGYGNACDADFNNDCVVNSVDLNLLRAAFFTSDPIVDLDGNGVVNVSDLLRLKQAFFGAPGPSGVSSTCASR